MAAPSTDVPAEQIAKMKEAFALFERDELPSPAELGAVFKIIGQDLSEEQLKGMIAYVAAERNNTTRVLPPGMVQSVELPEAVKPGNSAIHRSAFAKDILVTYEPQIQTLYDLFRVAAERFAERPCLGERQINSDGTPGGYAWQTYREAYARSLAIGAGVTAKTGLTNGSFLGINLVTSAAWTLLHQSNFAYGRVTVTLYDTFGVEALEYIVRHAGLPAVATSNPAQFLGFAERAPTLRYLIVVGTPITDELRRSADEHKISLFTLEDIEATGRATPLPPTPPRAEDLAFICYTSGTTGNPKGVVHAHRDMVSSVSGAIADQFEVTSDDVHIAFLPLAHIMEMFAEEVMLWRGAALGFYRGDTLKLMDDIAALKPTVFIAVPRLLNRIYDKVTAGAASAAGIKKVLGGLAVESKKRGLAKGYVRSFWDFVVFKNVAATVLGGRVRAIVTGSAPVAPEVLGFLRIFFSCLVFEGYGMTEVLVTNLTHSGDFLPGTVGPPLPCVDIKLVDIPDMDYYSSDKPYPRGEICFRGPTVLSEYYKEPEKTREALDADGWFHSGDVGLWLPNGTLKIIDRVKNIFKLSQGEYVAPEKLENVYARSPFVGQSFVYGDSLQPFLVAVVVPDPEIVLPWAKTKPGLEGLDLAALCERPELKAATLESMNEVAKATSLSGFEYVKAVHLVPTGFTTENDLLTPTFKLKRFQARKHFQKEIEALYKALSAN